MNMTLGLHFQPTPFHARFFGRKPKTKIMTMHVQHTSGNGSFFVSSFVF